MDSTPLADTENAEYPENRHNLALTRSDRSRPPTKRACAALKAITGHRLRMLESVRRRSALIAADVVCGMLTSWDGTLPTDSA